MHEGKLGDFEYFGLAVSTGKKKSPQFSLRGFS
jgi:hypothetical protein